MTRKNGCHNRAPLRETVRTQDGWGEAGDTRIPAMRTYPVPMTKDCQYTLSDLGKVDSGCDGCRWKDTK